MPLEHNTVRFVDNFSAGTRGSASAEYFLDHGYAVIFMHRLKSLEPFTRHFTGQQFFDMLDVAETVENGESGTPSIFGKYQHFHLYTLSILWSYLMHKCCPITHSIYSETGFSGCAGTNISEIQNCTGGK